MERQHEQFHGARASNLCTLRTIKSGVTASHEKEKAARTRDLCPHYSSSQSSSQSLPSLLKHTGFLLEGSPLGFFGGDSGRSKPMLQRSYRSGSLPFQLSRPGVLDPEPGLEMGTFIGLRLGGMLT